MRALGVKPLENAVDEILALVAPFVQGHAEEWRLQVRQPATKRSFQWGNAARRLQALCQIPGLFQFRLPK